MKLLNLANGSDIRGVAMEGVEGEPVTLTPAGTCCIGQSFVSWLEKDRGKKKETLRIGIGYDSRVTAQSLFAGVAAGITGLGAKVYDCGMVSTPSMFMTTVMEETQFDGSIMITASHLPFNRNGLKFLHGTGGLESKEILEILQGAEACEEIPGKMEAMEKMDTLSLYCRDLRNAIQQGISGSSKPLAGIHIVVDAGNGAGGFFAKEVLAPLGADISGSKYLEPDGYFPNHIPNPENPQAMKAIQEAVLSSKADFGFIFDTDVDRMSLVLSDGREVNRDALIALISAVLSKEYPGSTIVTDSVTSDRLQVFMEGLGLHQHRFKRGYKNVINECMRLNQEGIVSPLAIETSGHGALKENYYLDDGAYMAVKLIIAAANAAKNGSSLGSYIQSLPDAVEEREYRLSLPKEDFRSIGEGVLKRFQENAQKKGYQVVPDSYEGVRLRFQQEEIRGWLLLRVSLHDPKMPLNLEGEREGDCDRMLLVVKDLLSGEQGIEIPF